MTACDHIGSWHSRSWVEDGEMMTICDKCGLEGAGQAVPDVYWPGHPYHSKALDVEFTSREHKAQVLKERGLVETGDTVNGSRESRTQTWQDALRNVSKKEWREESRPKVQQVYKAWLDRRRG